jgi:hypothetical protein
MHPLGCWLGRHQWQLQMLQDSEDREQDFTPVSILSEAHYTWVLSLVSPFQTIAGSRSQVWWASTSQPYHHK